MTHMKELSTFFKSVLDQDRASIVLCDLNHKILYMNPAAIRNYAKRGGEKLIGQNLFGCHNSHSQELIKKTLDWFQASADHNIIYEFHNEKENRDAYTVALRDEEGKLIGYYEKHEYRNPETAKFYDFSDK
jgi:PAS domain-containing protein